MDCERYRLMISKELDGELAPTLRAELEEHLSVCPDCMRYYELVKETNLMYERKADIEPPATLLPSIIAATTGRRKEAALWRGWLKAGAVAASIALIVLGASIGGKLADLYLAPDSEQVAIEETLGLDYLGDTPPGSVGYALFASSGGDENE